MRNSKGATIYYLFFASPNRTGSKILTQIFNNYRSWGSNNVKGLFYRVD